MLAYRGSCADPRGIWLKNWLKVIALATFSQPWRDPCENKKARKLFILRALCPGQDLNLHELPRYHLKVVRLPIPPPGRGYEREIIGSFGRLSRGGGWAFAILGGGLGSAGDE